MSQLQHQIEAKMRAANVGAPTISAFLPAVARAVSGQTGLVPEDAIEPITSLPSLEEQGSLESKPAGASAQLANWVRRLAVIKLNGGLGTGMGLQTAKSLIPVKGGLTFLDFIARQML